MSRTALLRFLRRTDPERGTYRNHFHAAQVASALVPRPSPHVLRKPTAPGAQHALVVGLEGEAFTTDRDYRVKVQLAWQRGERPLPGQCTELKPPPPCMPGADGAWIGWCCEVCCAPA